VNGEIMQNGLLNNMLTGADFEWKRFVKMENKVRHIEEEIDAIILGEICLKTESPF
jgi:hypothetical protein